MGKDAMVGCVQTDSAGSAPMFPFQAGLGSRPWPMAPTIPPPVKCPGRNFGFLIHMSHKVSCRQLGWLPRPLAPRIHVCLSIHDPSMTTALTIHVLVPCRKPTPPFPFRQGPPAIPHWGEMGIRDILDAPPRAVPCPHPHIRTSPAAAGRRRATTGYTASTMSHRIILIIMPCAAAYLVLDNEARVIMMSEQTPSATPLSPRSSDSPPTLQVGSSASIRSSDHDVDTTSNIERGLRNRLSDTTFRGTECVPRQPCRFGQWSQHRYCADGSLVVGTEWKRRHLEGGTRFWGAQ